MKKVIAKIMGLVIMLLPICITAGCQDEVDEIVSIKVCSEFEDLDLYVGDNIDINQYFFTIKYESGRTAELQFQDAEITGLDTATAGTREFTLTFNNTEYKFEYQVKAVVPTNGTYKGQTIQLFEDEQLDKENITITILYNNGSEKVVKLKDCTVGDIDYTAFGEKQELTVTYEGIEVKIPYQITRIQAQSARYLGTEQTVYYNEGLDLDNLRVEVLYNNGTSQELTLREFDVDQLDYTVDGQTRTVEARYEGITVEIQYTVIYRPLQLNTEYIIVRPDFPGTEYRCEFYMDEQYGLCIRTLDNPEDPDQDTIDYSAVFLDNNECLIEYYWLESESDFVNLRGHLEGNRIILTIEEIPEEE